MSQPPSSIWTPLQCQCWRRSPVGSGSNWNPSGRMNVAEIANREIAKTIAGVVGRRGTPSPSALCLRPAASAGFEPRSGSLDLPVVIEHHRHRAAALVGGTASEVLPPASALQPTHPQAGPAQLELRRSGPSKQTLTVSPCMCRHRSFPMMGRSIFRHAIDNERPAHGVRPRLDHAGTDGRPSRTSRAFNRHR